MARIACIQLCSGDDMAANIAHVQNWVAQAAGMGAQLVALPENAFLMEDPKGERSRMAEAGHPALAACSQLVLLLGVVQHISLGLEQAEQTMNWRVAHLGERLQRMEAAAGSKSREQSQPE